MPLLSLLLLSPARLSFSSVIRRRQQDLCRPLRNAVLIAFLHPVQHRISPDSSIQTYERTSQHNFAPAFLFSRLSYLTAGHTSSTASHPLVDRFIPHRPRGGDIGLGMHQADASSLLLHLYLTCRVLRGLGVSQHSLHLCVYHLSQKRKSL